MSWPSSRLVADPSRAFARFTMNAVRPSMSRRPRGTGTVSDAKRAATLLISFAKSIT